MKKEQRQKEKNGLRQNRGTGSAVSLFAVGLLLMFIMPWMVYSGGAGAAWIAIGSFAGVLLVWQMASYRLMRFSLQHKDQATIPGFFSSRFQEKRPVLRIFFSVILLPILILTAGMLLYGISDFAATLFGISRLYTTLGIFFISTGFLLLLGRGGLRLAERWIAILVLVSLILIDYSVIRVLGTRHALENIFHSWAAGSVTEYVNVGYMSGKALSVQEIISLFSIGFLILGNPLVLQRFQFADRARTIHRSRRWAIIFSLFSLFLSVLTGGLLRAALYPAKISNIRMLYKTILTEDKGRGFLFLLAGMIFVVAAGLMVLELFHSTVLSATEILHSDVFPLKKHRKKMILGSKGIVILAGIIVETLVFALALCSGDWIYRITWDAYLVLACGLAPVMYLALRSSRTTVRACLLGFSVGAVFVGVWEFSAFIPQGTEFLTLREITGISGIIPAMLMGFFFGLLGIRTSKPPTQEVVTAYEEVQFRLVSSGEKKR